MPRRNIRSRDRWSPSSLDLVSTSEPSCGVASYFRFTSQLRPSIFSLSSPFHRNPPSFGASLKTTVAAILLNHHRSQWRLSLLHPMEHTIISCNSRISISISHPVSLILPTAQVISRAFVTSLFFVVNPLALFNQLASNSEDCITSNHLQFVFQPCDKSTTDSLNHRTMLDSR